MNTKRKTIFLDRDGVINKIVHRGEDFFVFGKKAPITAPFSYDEFLLNDGVDEALEKMGDLGYLRVVVTNQPDIAYGHLPKAEHEKIVSSLMKLPIDDFYACFHKRDDGCNCRKPKTGMFEQADHKWSIDFSKSYVIGDSLTDIQAGESLGLRTILIKAEYNSDVEADLYAKDLKEAINLIEKDNK